MNSSRIVRQLAVAVALALLAACAGTQTVAVPFHENAKSMHAKSWILPEATTGNLLYVSSSTIGTSGDDIYIFSYPQGKLVGQLSLPQYAPMGLCSDDNGNVFVTTFGDETTLTSYVYEYAHGGTAPIATLNDPGFGNDCSVDHATHNLAVANWFGLLGSFDHGSIAIYQDATGTAKPYYDSSIYWYQWCAYDDVGNL